MRRLPSVEALAARLSGVPHPLAVLAARGAIEEARSALADGGDPEARLGELEARAAARAAELARPSLRPVINATGIVLHTNLGRAPLAAEAIEQLGAVAAGYSNLEYDLVAGERGSRADHLRAGLVALTGAEDALAVNNNAAAVLLALAAGAAGREVIVSRGELVEIGGSFRIPEIMELSGATLVEVGTTNRTRTDDYRGAIGPETAALLRVHRSNFRTVGFVEQPPLAELAGLATERGLALIDDLGSGALAPIADEPTVGASVGAGADLVCFSADKLLGGPQAGIICGHAAAVAACARHPLARALRLDKLQLAALEATVRVHRRLAPGPVPVTAMLAADESELERRAASLAAAIGAPATVERARALPGGGALPLVELEGPVCALAAPGGEANRLAARLRANEPPVIARIEADRVILDPRTFTDAEAEPVCAAAIAALGR